MSDPCEPDGICASSAPALLGERLVGTPYTLADVAAALARGQRPPGLTAAQLRLAEAYAERGPDPA